MSLHVVPVPGIGEVTVGTDLARLVTEHAELLEGDVVVVTSKIVSKALGLTSRSDRDTVVDQGTDRVVARRGPTRIVRTWSGLTLAAAGVDASNVEVGTVLSLPDDPDAEARAIRHGIAASTGLQVGVVISDTAGRAWRVGQTDIAIGCAGLAPFESFAGREDVHGNALAVTAPAVADEVASAAELASGKLGGLPVVVVRGLPAHLLLQDDGPGAAALVRAEDDDLFGLGSRDAVVAALGGSGGRGFPTDPQATLALVLDLARPGTLPVAVAGEVVEITARRDQPDEVLEAGALRQRVESLALAHRLPATVVVTLA
ncbi:MAG: coenzyme F420-0:L-glutamate ligase [Actinomycetales bacterium]|nr:MAG: coenzyme F420-0:L-glutamate ligase [Actinomycetales bacterium]